ncbi:MAG: hypothetical protein OEY85_13450, partial [Rhodospirillales bacterium]|nr:hypothetical protein [Rhodospirillales bacterium]
LLLVASGTLVAIATGIVLIHMGSRLNSSNWAITDCRIISLDGLLRRSRQEIPLSAIEDAKYEDAKLTLSGRGKVVQIRAKQIPADVLCSALTEWFPSAGQPVQRLGHILDADETVLFRQPSRWDYAYPAAALSLFIWLAMGQQDWAPRGNLTLAILLVVAGLLFRDAYRWTVAITDRRLLRRLSYDPSRYEAFPMSEVEAVPPSPFGDRLFVKLHGYELQLPAKGKDAERLRAAIEAAKGAA